MSEIIIEQMTKKNVHEVAKIEEHCFSTPWSIDSLQAELSKDNSYFFLARNSFAGALGYVGLNIVFDEGYIQNLAVLPNFRRGGVARLLVEHIIGLAIEKKLSFLTLEVRESNTAAIQLYTKFGFNPVGRRKKFYEKPTEDALLLTVPINQTIDVTSIYQRSKDCE